MPQFRRKVNDLIECRMRDAPHHQLNAGRLDLIPAGRYRFQLLPKPRQVPLDLVPCLTQVFQFHVSPVFFILNLAEPVQITGADQVVDRCPVRGGAVLRKHPF